jgi:Nitrous oxide-stimulated promoter
MYFKLYMNREFQTVQLMISLYCRKKHHQQNLCNQCRELLEYASERISRCRFGEQKPVCRKCTIHCYKAEMREKIRAVMRFSGPGMIVYHPLIALNHLIRSLRNWKK